MVRVFPVFDARITLRVPCVRCKVVMRELYCKGEE